MTQPTPKTCCVCGTYAGKWLQHWNRDTGYGICPRCVAEEAGRCTPDDLQDLYGKPGVHYDQPMVRHMGRRYRCLAAFPNTPAGERDANAFMDRTPHACVLCATDGIYIADERDQGEPAPHQETAR